MQSIFKQSMSSGELVGSGLYPFSFSMILRSFKIIVGKCRLTILKDCVKKKTGYYNRFYSLSTVTRLSSSHPANTGSGVAGIGNPTRSQFGKVLAGCRLSSNVLRLTYHRDSGLVQNALSEFSDKRRFAEVDDTCGFGSLSITHYTTITQGLL